MTKDQVERAAIALHKAWHAGEDERVIRMWGVWRWANCDESEKERWRRLARAALTAAAPSPDQHSRGDTLFVKA